MGVGVTCYPKEQQVTPRGGYGGTSSPTRNTSNK